MCIRWREKVITSYLPVDWMFSGFDAGLVGLGMLSIGLSKPTSRPKSKSSNTDSLGICAHVVC